MALTMAMTIAFAGCSGNSTSTDTDSETEETTDTEADADAENEEGEADEEVVEFPDTAYADFVTAEDYVTLGEYTGLSVSANAVEVSDDDVEAQYESYNEANTIEVTDRAVQEGDLVDIDYVGTYADSGEEFDGGSAEGYTLEIGSDSFIEGFEDGLIGANIGDNLDLNLTFPEDYSSEDLAGVDVVFNVTVNGITEQVDLTDETVAELDFNGITTVAGLKEYIRENLESEEEEYAQDDGFESLVDMIKENCTFEDAPEDMVNRYYTQLMKNVEETAAYYAESWGTEIDADTLLESELGSYGYEGTGEEMATAYAEDYVKELLMFKAICNAEGLTIDDSEITSQVTEMLEYYGYETEDEYNTAYNTNLTYELREQQTFTLAQDFLMENNTINVEWITQEEADAIEAEENAELEAETEEDAETDEDGHVHEDGEEHDHDHDHDDADTEESDEDADADTDADEATEAEGDVTLEEDTDDAGSSDESAADASADAENTADAEAEDDAD